MTESFAEQLVLHIKAGYQILSVNTPEEPRAIIEIRRAGWLMSDGKKPADMNINNFKKDLEEIFNKVGIEEKIESKNTWKINAANLIKAYDYIVNNNSYENLQKLILSILNSNGLPVITWNSISGFDDKQSTEEADFFVALEKIISANRFPSRCLIVLKDAHPYLNGDEPRYRRLLRNLFEERLLVSHDVIQHHLIFLQPIWKPHQDIKHCITNLEFSLPDENQLDNEISYIANSVSEKTRAALVPELRYSLKRALRGFTQSEAENVLSYCITKHRGFSDEMVKTVHKLKAATFKGDNVLDYVDEETIVGMDQIGGYDNFIEFIDECVDCDNDEARNVGIKPAKGILLLGIPGVGKSVAAMAVAKKFKGRPLIKYNFGAVFNSLVGESENTQYHALNRIRAVGPCVLLIDEADKAFAGVVGSHGDSGVSQRVFGQLLSWMANDNHDAFVVMTMNRLVDPVTGANIVPIETIRAGRIDATFFVTFPTKEERKQIIEIHLKKNKCNPGLFSKGEWNQILTVTDNFVGSELEQIVLKSIRTAFRYRKSVQPTFDEFMEARNHVSPVSILDEINIRKINEFCKDRAIPVSHNKTKQLDLYANMPTRRIDNTSNN